MDLDQLRLRLDAIDAQVLALLSERAGAVLDIGDYKRKHRLPIHVPEREKQRGRTAAGKTTPDRYTRTPLSAFYRTIIEEMRKLEEEHVGRVGESGAIKTT